MGRGDGDRAVDPAQIRPSRAESPGSLYFVDRYAGIPPPLEPSRRQGFVPLAYRSRVGIRLPGRDHDEPFLWGRRKPVGRLCVVHRKRGRSGGKNLPSRWVQSSQIPGAYTICTAMYGSGCKTGTAAPIQVPNRWTLPELIRALPALCAAAALSITPATCGRPNASALIHRSATVLLEPA